MLGKFGEKTVELVCLLDPTTLSTVMLENSTKSKKS